MASEQDPKAFAFEGYWDGVRVTGTARADSEQVTIVPVPGKTLEIPLDTFSRLFSTLMIAAYSRGKS